MWEKSTWRNIPQKPSAPEMIDAIKDGGGDWPQCIMNYQRVPFHNKIWDTDIPCKLESYLNYLRLHL